jgi:hypothetical protein
MLNSLGSYNVMALGSLDTFGWSLLLFLGLLFGIPYARYIKRIRAIPGWPTKLATIVGASAERGSPFGYGYGLSYCVVLYEFEVVGNVYKGGFVLMAGDDLIASTVAQNLLNSTVQVTYNPKRPNDSLPVETKILGRKVLQRQSWLNPNIW